MMLEINKDEQQRLFLALESYIIPGALGLSTTTSIDTFVDKNKTMPFSLISGTNDKNCIITVMNLTSFLN